MAVKKIVVWLKPKPGIIVRDPDNKKPLPPEGKLIEQSSYWLRRLMEGSVEIVDPEKKEPAPKKKKKKDSGFKEKKTEIFNED